MKAYDLKPTFENLLNTYKSDAIDRNSDIFHFTEILNAIEDSCTIALEGKWGSGKTFFVKQVKMIMDAHNRFINNDDDKNREEIIAARNNYYGQKNCDLQPQVCVYYDAWENDNDDDPVLSLVYTILNSVDADFDFRKTNFIKAGASILEFFTGRKWTQLIENLKGTSSLNAVKDRKDVKTLVGEFLDTLIPEKGNRLVVFVDELDRCKPSYAVCLLERIKHYFTNDNITFVFSVNTNELQHTIKKYYGTDFDGSGYLDRFFDLRISLSPPNMKKYLQSLNFRESRYMVDTVCDAVIKAYDFQLREIAKFLRLTKIAVYEATHGGFQSGFSDRLAIYFCSYYVVPIMIGLKIKDIRRYNEFIEGRDYTPLVEIAEYVKTYRFNELLNNDETFSDGESDKLHVTLDVKLKAVYNAIFVTSYTGTNYYTMIGDLEFDKKTKDDLLRIAGLLSDYTTLNMV